jgi:hypothetical protein
MAMTESKAGIRSQIKFLIEVLGPFSGDATGTAIAGY